MRGFADSREVIPRHKARILAIAGAVLFVQCCPPARLVAAPLAPKLQMATLAGQSRSVRLAGVGLAAFE